ncbi:hypothetical protein [Coleofasciculus sp. F4-SAH-05]|uniref:hypothetical protein n=1 Tax=Coleofasciculus sp. F4-SAH-05 TaxID=3069525 RepID=UPI0032FCE079
MRNYTTIEDCAIAWRTKPLVYGEIGWRQCACDRVAGQVGNMPSIKEMIFLRFKYAKITINLRLIKQQIAFK